MAEATILMSGTRPRIRRAPWWNAAIAASVPWPSASGASRKTMIPEIRPPSATMSGIAHGRVNSPMGAAPSPSGDGGTYPPSVPRKNRVARSSRTKNRAAPRPLTTPMIAPRTTHLRR